MSEDVTPELVEITSIRPDATKITGKELQPNDRVFDAYGNTYALVSVRRLKGGRVSFKRSDSTYRQHIGADEPITVVRVDKLLPVKMRDGFSKPTHGVAYFVDRVFPHNSIDPARQMVTLRLKSDARYTRNAFLDDLRTMDDKPVKLTN